MLYKSYLKTQDLANTQLWVWLDYKTYELSKNIVPKHDNIFVKNIFLMKKQKEHYLKIKNL